METTFISLGSNCCITWWLREYGLRKFAFPFDWSNITIKQLILVLENDFKDYIDSIEIKFLSDKHPSQEGLASFVLSNAYNIKFAHEVLTDKHLDDFKLSLLNRIDRFKKVKDLVVYIRIELTIIKSGYIKELQKLLKLLDIINPNYILKLIIHKNSIKINLDKVEIHYFNNFSPDWKMSCLNWKTILTNSS
jgi:hypothetical protein